MGIKQIKNRVTDRISTATDQLLVKTATTLEKAKIPRTLEHVDGEQLVVMRTVAMRSVVRSVSRMRNNTPPTTEPVDHPGLRKAATYVARTGLASSALAVLSTSHELPMRKLDE